MELKDLLVLYRRWFWLLIAGLVLGLVSGFAASKVQSPVYESSAKVLITRSRQQGSTDILSISDQQLVLTYLQLLKTKPVLDDVGSRLSVNVDKDNIKVDVIPNTQILQIQVQDQDPYQAAAIANELVQVLIEQNETLQAGRYTAYEKGLNTQVTQVQEQLKTLQSQITQIDQANIQDQLSQVDQQIKDLQGEISTLEKDVAAFPTLLSATDRAKMSEKQSQLNQLRSLLFLYQQIQTNLVYLGKPAQGTGQSDPQLSSLQATLTLYQQLYLDLLNNLEAVKLARAQSTPTVTEIEEAVVPEKPIRPIPLLYTALAGTVGLMIAAGAVLLKDYLDDTVQSSQKVRETLGLPVLAEIVQADKNEQDRKSSSSKSGSPFLNSFGILRMNVTRLLAGNPRKSVLVTSGALGEGKTTIAANLAVAYAQAGNKVILIDADFYKPGIQTYLNLKDQKGLSDILVENFDWREVAQESHGVIIITSGHQSEVTAFQFESEAMTQLLKHLQEETDVIIIDGPPLLMVDSQALSTQVGGVLLVIRQANTSVASVRTILDQLKLMGVNVLGVALNRVPRSGTYYHGAYGYFPDGHHKATTEDEEDDVKHHQ
jgi:capsular exopolysaccharide synthesis family protein